MSDPKVSVIVTARDYARFLPNCLDSILEQTFRDFEAVVVDDGSTDETPSVLAGYEREPRFRSLRLAGVGLAAAANRGIEASRGAYVIRLDADDWFAPEILDRQVELLDGDDGLGMVYPDYQRADEAGRTLDRVRLADAATLRRRDLNPLAAAAMFRRSAFDAVGGYDERLRYQEDYDFWLRFTDRFRVQWLAEPLLFYRQHGGSMSKNREPRAAARRYVKRGYVQARGLDRPAVAYVRAGGLREDEEALTRPLPGGSLLVRTIAEARACPGVAGVLVATRSEVLAGIARGESAVVIDPEMPLEEAWPGVELVLGLSPRHPFRNPARGREALDTLVMHGLRIVVPVEPGQLGRVSSDVANGTWPWSSRPAVFDVLSGPWPNAPAFWANDLAIEPEDDDEAGVEIWGLESFRVDDAESLERIEPLLEAPPCADSHAPS